MFQCSSASRKFLNTVHCLAQPALLRVSVLFSEPKIPQFSPVSRLTSSTTPFSALQRAENSSISRCLPQRRPRAPFSALQRAENSSMTTRAGRRCDVRPFSALQRAENSSIAVSRHSRRRGDDFQCSSASRKFLNCAPRCSAASGCTLSVLFSEPKIPQ